MKKQLYFLCIGFAFAGIAFLLLKGLKTRPDRARKEIAPPPASVVSHLASQVSALPKPTLAQHAPLSVKGGISSTPAKKATPPSGSAPCLTEAQLEPLRRAFSPLRFREDPTLPRARQTLLSNRLLISPVQRSIPNSVSGKQSATPRRTTPFLVQFNTPVSDASRTLLTDAGAIVRGYFPNNALLAELTPSALAALEEIPAVQSASEFLPTDKIQPFLSSLMASQPAGTRVRVTVQTFAPEDTALAASAIRNEGGTVETVTAGIRWGTVQAIVALGSVKALSAHGAIQWIEERAQIQNQNDKAAIPSHLNTTNAWFTWGLTGKGQIIGHADTGLDTGDLATLHPDFQNRIVALIARGRTDDPSDPDGHGTHTAGSILGDGSASDGKYRGSAWEAGLVHQSIMDAYGYLDSGIGNLYTLFQESYDYGARIHSDSWGADTYGEYDDFCRATDLFAWTNPDHLAVFANGNAGRDSDSDGIVDTGSVGSPASAKNVLAVGATENDRPIGTGGYSLKTWGSAWPSRFPASPIKADFISYSATASPYRQGMAGFSSRGPTLDNRIKPDVVAPGTDVISTKSSLGGSLWGNLASNSRYCFSGGTSMSTPLMAGCAALLRQYAVERAGITNPSAALLKAMLIGGSRSLTPGQYGTSATQEIPSVSPNDVEGWGQPDVGTTVHPSGRMIRLFDRISPLSGATNRFTITVTASNAPLDIALSWIDYPATPGAAVTLVNDLDLIVRRPDGSALFSNGGTTPDRVNTVETVRIDTAEPGLYHVDIVGAAVPFSGGVAALYVRGAIDAPPVMVHTPLGNQADTTPAYTIDYLVQSVSPLTNNETCVTWAAGTGSGATGTWQTTEGAWVTNSTYRAEIPSVPSGTFVYYTLSVETGGYDIRLPEAAPDAAFSFYVGNLVTLTIQGTPSPIGSVTPPYGTNYVIAHVAFEATASSAVMVSNGIRHVCSGWAGEGDVPAAGTSNSVTLSISQPSVLSWSWTGEMALTNRYRLADTGQTFDESVSWYPEGALATTETALEIGFVGSDPYALCGWTVDGARWPDATSSSPNPATAIPMTQPHLAQADYLPFWLDSDGNDLSDWWELRQFGSSSSGLNADDDLDGDLWTNLGEFLDNTDPRDPASQPTPPTITVETLAPFQSERPPWTIRAVITDNFVVNQADLVWRESGDSDWLTTEMTWTSDDTYEAAIDPPSHGAKIVEYYIYAADLIGYYVPEYGVTSQIYRVSGFYDTPWLAVTPERLDTVELDETPTNLTLTVENWAGPDLAWTARVAMADAPFAATNALWSHFGINDVWSVTTNRTWNGDAVWYCGSTSTFRYPNNCYAILDTPPFVVGTGGGLLFRQWIKTEPDTSPYFWDGAVLRISTDGGQSFTVIEPTDGYPALIVDNPASPFPANQPCLAGTGEGWQTLILDLAAYTGQSVIIRFEFGSDSYVTDEGWYLANVTPFSLDGTAPSWLTPTSPWGGVLPDGWEAPLSFSLNPSGITPNDEVQACIRLESNDPDVRLIPVTVRRGYRLLPAAHGPGSASTDRTFLFRNDQATVTLQANDGCYLYALLENGVPQPGVFSYDTTAKTLVFSHLNANIAIDAWFSPKIWQLTITTPYSSCAPSEGTYSLTNGTPVEVTVVSPVSLNNSIRHETTGWTLTGHIPNSGTASQCSFSITNDATLSWNWSYAYILSTSSGPHGSLSPTGGWYRAGSSVVMTAYPSLYYHFGAWSGDISDVGIDGPRLTCVVIAPRTITASFDANMTPTTHPVPEYWLASYGWLTDFESVAEDDSDNDGMPNWAEWRADTNPTDPLSLLTLTGIRLSGSSGQFTWIGGNARTQYLEQASALSGPWMAIATNLPPTPVTNTVTLPTTGNAGFFRVRIP